MAVARAVLANRRLARDENIPGAKITPDQICQNGLIRFDRENPNSDDLSGYLHVSYIWLLALCVTYQGDIFSTSYNCLNIESSGLKKMKGLAGGFSWSDFERLMIKIRKIKSLVFDNGDTVTIGQLHRGAVMDRETASMSFINHHLRDDLSVYQKRTFMDYRDRDCHFAKFPSC